MEEFDELKNDPEFKDFLFLQRNIGNKTKQIWADDAENVVLPSKKPDIDIVNVNVEKSTNQDESQPRKRHKRSRGKKKSTKTKPQEFFVHTIKIKNFPETTRRKDVKDFFKPLEILSVRLNKKDDVCYVSFKDESDMRFAMRKNLQFCGTNRIRMWRHNVNRSRVYKETVKEKKKKVMDERIKKQQAAMAECEPIEESGRLFVRNLNYTCKQEDLEEVFSKYGKLTEVHFPVDKTTSQPVGFAYVEFMFPENAATAFNELNNTIFQGRNLHLIPSKPKPGPRFREGPLTGANTSELQSSFKREKMQQQKQAAPNGSNWNILFLGQNALANVVSDMKGVEKSELLTKHSSKEPIAVRMALGDAMVVEEMRNFLVSNGIELDSFDNPQAPRSKTVILVKNLPSSTDKSEISQLFEAHGRFARVIMPPNGLTAIVEMEEPNEAKMAFKKLAYSKFKDTILYLEWAPINVFREKSLEEQDQVETKQLLDAQTGTKILVKNVPFEATLPELRKIFAVYGELNFVRIPKKLDGQHRGFGFVDYLTKEDAMRAFKALSHSTHLYGRKLVLEWAKADNSNAVQNNNNNK